MRLSQADVTAIVSALDPYLKHSNSQLFLFGSRVHDHLKGGDIDLLLITEEALQMRLVAEKYIVLSDIKALIGDQKIDLAIATPDTIQTDPFLQAAYDNTVLIHQWT